MGAADVTQVREMRLGNGKDEQVNPQVRVISRRNYPPGPVSGSYFQNCLKALSSSLLPRDQYRR